MTDFSATPSEELVRMRLPLLDELKGCEDPIRRNIILEKLHELSDEIIIQLRPITAAEYDQEALRKQFNDKLRARIQELEAQVSAANPSPEDYQRQADEIKLLKELNSSQDGLIVSLNASNRDLESRNSEMAKELDKFKKLNASLIDRNTQMKRVKEDLDKECTQMKRVEKELDAECTKLLQKNIQILGTQQKMGQEFQAERAQMTNHIRRLEMEAALSAERIRQFQEKEREAEANPRSFYSGEYLRLSGINAQLELEKSNDEKTKRRLTSEVGRQELMVIQEREKTRTCTARAASLWESLKRTHKEMARLLEENAASRDEKVGLVSQIRGLNSEILALKAANSSLLAEYRDLEEDTRPLAQGRAAHGRRK